MTEPYRRARLTSFLNPWDHAGDAGFQAVQGQIAIGSGGAVRHGLGESVQKIFYLPEAHTDFILAIIGEEVGLAGICGADRALRARSPGRACGSRSRRKGRYAALLAARRHVACPVPGAPQLFAVLGIAPLTGVPLPFISYGSTNLVVLLVACGLL